jgi:hypothetical protein
MDLFVDTLEILGTIAIAVGAGLSFGLGIGLIIGGLITIGWFEIPQHLADRNK